MPVPPQNRSEDPHVNNLDRGNEEDVQAYLAVTDDGELARLAAMMTPKSVVFDARAQVAQSMALQAEAAAELVRRREAIASSMTPSTLRVLARQLGVGDIKFLHMMDAEGFTNPVTGPVLRRLASLMRDMPPPQDFQDQFLAENPTAALKLAASSTTLPRPLPDAPFEEALRYAANIPTDEVSWDILEGAFFDFLRITCLYPSLPEELFPVKTEAGAKLTKTEFSQLVANLKLHQQELASFHETFAPGQDFPPGIDEVAHRAYVECWEGGLLGPSWLRRLAWLAVEFTPFWKRHGGAYRSTHDALAKTAEDARKKKSAKAKKAGETGRQRREGERWRTVTADFIDFLKEKAGGSAPVDLQDCATAFVGSSPSLGGKLKMANSLEFLQALCTAVTKGLEARTVLDTLQRSLLAKIEALKPAFREQRLNKLVPNQRKQYLSKGTIPPKWIQFKSLTEEAISACLEDLKDALAKAGVKKIQK